MPGCCKHRPGANNGADSLDYSASRNDFHFARSGTINAAYCREIAPNGQPPPPSSPQKSAKRRTENRLAPNRFARQTWEVVCL
jgi:hypothetical protein